ncbi:zinc finger protein [Penicillium sp. IBT 16267x]|nr:zinc finger protein [Penicillium sp. IBT 16267x]
MRTQHDPTSNYTRNIVDFSSHQNIDIPRQVLPKTQKDYTRTLVLFDKFLILHPYAMNPPDIRTSTASLEWIGRGMRGRIEERPTVETVQDFREHFHIEILDSLELLLTEYIKGELRVKIGLSTAEMNKDGVSPNDLTILMTQLWCRDYHEYRGNPADRTRVQLSAAMLLYCFTSARTGEVHESTARRNIAQETDKDSADYDLEARVLAACYKHFVLTIETVDGMPMLVLTNEREFVKGYWRKSKWEISSHAFYEVYAQDDVPIFLNFLTFFLPMAAADKAFKDSNSVSSILDAVERHENSGPSENKVLEVIQFREEFKETPVFRQYRELHIENSKGKARGADAFGKALVQLGYRSGYTRNVTIRNCRRWALQEVDKKYSESTRMKFAGQVNRDTYGKYYAHPLSEIDGPANYLGIASRQEHIQNRRGMGLYRSFLKSLPAKAEYEFLDRQDIRELDDQMRSLSALICLAKTEEDKHDIRLKQKKLYASKQLQSDAQREGFQNDTLFNYRRRVMPHRDFLAITLPCSIGLRHKDGRRALEALESLCSETETVLYL